MIQSGSLLWLIWQNEQTRQKYHVGNLTHDGSCYRFYYERQGHRKLEDAMESGFKLHLSFPDKDKVYESRILFAPFARRLPDRKRPDYQQILRRLGLPPEVTEMDLLKATGGKLATDSYEFVSPVIVYGEDYHFDFYIHGWRYHDGEKMVDQLLPGQELLFQSEPANPRDPFAVKILTTDGQHHLGYVPSFYSPFVTNILNGLGSYQANIEQINPKVGTKRNVLVSVVGSLRCTPVQKNQDVLEPVLLT